MAYGWVHHFMRMLRNTRRESSSLIVRNTFPSFTRYQQLMNIFKQQWQNKGYVISKISQKEQNLVLENSRHLLSRYNFFFQYRKFSNWEDCVNHSLPNLYSDKIDFSKPTNSKSPINFSFADTFKILSRIMSRLVHLWQFPRTWNTNPDFYFESSKTSNKWTR